MTLSPSLRKLVLAIHVITTMGWLGSAAAYIPIAAYVLNSQDADMVRSAIQIMSLNKNSWVHSYRFTFFNRCFNLFQLVILLDKHKYDL